LIVPFFLGPTAIKSPISSAVTMRKSLGLIPARLEISKGWRTCSERLLRGSVQRWRAASRIVAETLPRPHIVVYLTRACYCSRDAHDLRTIRARDASTRPARLLSPGSVWPPEPTTAEHAGDFRPRLAANAMAEPKYPRLHGSARLESLRIELPSKETLT
jgi:hypothetical protein